MAHPPNQTPPSPSSECKGRETTADNSLPHPLTRGRVMTIRASATRHHRDQDNKGYLLLRLIIMVLRLVMVKDLALDMDTVMGLVPIVDRAAMTGSNPHYD